MVHDINDTLSDRPQFTHMCGCVSEVSAAGGCSLTLPAPCKTCDSCHPAKLCSGEEEEPRGLVEECGNNHLAWDGCVVLLV